MLTLRLRLRVETQARRPLVLLMSQHPVDPRSPWPALPRPFALVSVALVSAVPAAATAYPFRLRRQRRARGRGESTMLRHQRRRSARLPLRSPRHARAPPVATHRRRRGPRIIKSDPEDPHWLCDVLILPFACILEGDIELAPNLPVRVIGDANAPGLRQSLQTRGHIHAVAENVTSIDDDVADIDANPNSMRLSSGTSALRSAIPRWTSRATTALQLPAKLNQQPIAGVFYNTAAVFGNLGIDEARDGPGAGRACPLHRGPAQSAVASHIGGQNGGKPTLDALAGQGTPPR